jgi:hypothetical protein
MWQPNSMNEMQAQCSYRIAFEELLTIDRRKFREHSATNGFNPHPNGRSRIMKNVVISLALGVGALLSSGANAAPISVSPSLVPDSGIENVRLVCDEYGRCYRSRGSRRVIIHQGYGDSYNYAPRERYIERRGYYDGGYYNNGPSVGIGVGPGGVGVGVGVGPRW